jgi:UDP-N-acetylglucosamine 4,6-dehydratase
MPVDKRELGVVAWRRQNLLVTGGTGSFGRAFVKAMVNKYHPNKLVVFSRDELKQYEMRQEFPDGEGSAIRYFIGDVRDGERLRRAMNGIDIVVHAAAMKQVPACEYNPIEAVMTNVIGARNVIEAAIDSGVKRVMALSTDKAVSPVNLYGASKMVAEKLFVHANVYSGAGPTMFSCVRYGNVVGSRGSVIPLFIKQRASGKLTVTDPRMTRFWLTLEQGVEFVIHCLSRMRGGEVFVPKIPSASIAAIASAIAPECDTVYIGIRPGEKLHEVLISEDESRDVIEVDDMYILKAPSYLYTGDGHAAGNPLPEGFRYASDTNARLLTESESLELIEHVCGTQYAAVGAGRSRG